VTRLAQPLLALALALAPALAAAGCGAADDAQPGQPVAEQPPAEDEPAAAAVVVCDRAGETTLTPRVAASLDGVHVEIRNESGAERVVHVRTEDSAQGEGFPTGTHTRVWMLPPGSATVTCSDPAEDPGEQAGAPFEIDDPKSVWASTELDCDKVVAETIDYFVGAPGLQGEPVEVVAAADEVDIARDDVVEPAGYPDDAESPTVRVVRDGRVIAVVELVPAEDGGWLLTSVSRCDDR
jgi:hypothetical protein